MDFLVALGIGGAVALGELVSLYRDAPAKAVLTRPGGIYILLNTLASVAALALVRVFGWHFRIGGGGTEAQRWADVLVAGVGSMAVLRSSLFTVKVGDQSVAAGPGGFLQILLDAADRAVDRQRGADRASVVTRIMVGVRFDRAQVALPTFCIALMQNLSSADQVELRRNCDALAASPMPDAAKALSLGLLLLNVAGEGVLQAAIDNLGENIR